MKKVFMILVLISVFLLPMQIDAREGIDDNEGQSEQVQDRDSYDDAGQGNQVRNQNEIKTKNQGEDSQLQINTQEQESLQANQDEDNPAQSQQGNERSDNAREHMSEVAQKVEELLTIEDHKGGIGDEVRVVAQQQKAAQAKISSALDQIESRKGFAKLIMGADSKAVGALEQEMVQNQMRIKKLNQLQNMVQNQAEDTQLQEAIQAMEKQNTALENKLQSEKKNRGLLGWLAGILGL